MITLPCALARADNYITPTSIFLPFGCIMAIQMKLILTPTVMYYTLKPPLSRCFGSRGNCKLEFARISEYSTKYF